MSYQFKRPSATSSFFSAAQKGLDTAKGLHQTYKQMKQGQQPIQTSMDQSYGQVSPSAPPMPYAPPAAMIDDYPQFTQTVIDSISTGRNRYLKNIGENKQYREIQSIIHQIAELPPNVLLGKEPLPFKPKKGNFFGYKGGITRRKKSRGRKSRKH